MVSVFNHTRHEIGFGMSRRKAGTHGPGASVYTIDFGPGNNKIERSELEKCEAHPSWSDYVNRTEKRDLVGKKYKGVELEVGLHDEEFEVEFKTLGEKMKRLHELRVG